MSFMIIITESDTSQSENNHDSFDNDFICT